MISLHEFSVFFKHDDTKSHPFKLLFVCTHAHYTKHRTHTLYKYSHNFVSFLRVALRCVCISTYIHIIIGSNIELYYIPLRTWKCNGNAFNMYTVFEIWDNQPYRTNVENELTLTESKHEMNLIWIKNCGTHACALI